MVRQRDIRASTCSICGERHFAHGLCQRHYNQFWERELAPKVNHLPRRCNFCGGVYVPRNRRQVRCYKEECIRKQCQEAERRRRRKGGFSTQRAKSNKALRSRCKRLTIPKAVRHRKKWSTEDLALLSNLIKEKVGYMDIALTLGRTFDGLVGKITKLRKNSGKGTELL